MKTKLKITFIGIALTLITLFGLSSSVSATEKKWCLEFYTFQDAPIIGVCEIPDNIKKMYTNYEKETSYPSKRIKFAKLISKTYDKTGTPDDNIFTGLLFVDMSKTAIYFDSIENIENYLKEGYRILINAENEDVKKVGYKALVSIFLMDNTLGPARLVPCAQIAKTIVEEYPETEKYYPEEYKQVKEVYSKWNYGKKK